MNRIIPLCELRPHAAARIVDVPEDERDRLYALGFHEGAVVTPLFSAPSGGPTAYGVRGAAVALRRSDAKRIFVVLEGAWA